MGGVPSATCHGVQGSGRTRGALPRRCAAGPRRWLARHGADQMLLLLSALTHTHAPAPDSMHQTPHARHHASGTIHQASCTTHHTPYAVHHAAYTIRHTPYTMRHGPYTTHQTPSTRHQTPDTVEGTMCETRGTMYLGHGVPRRGPACVSLSKVAFVAPATEPSDCTLGRGDIVVKGVA